MNNLIELSMVCTNVGDSIENFVSTSFYEDYHCIRDVKNVRKFLKYVELDIEGDGEFRGYVLGVVLFDLKEDHNFGVIYDGDRLLHVYLEDLESRNVKYFSEDHFNPVVGEVWHAESRVVGGRDLKVNVSFE